MAIAEYRLIYLNDTIRNCICPGKAARHLYEFCLILIEQDTLFIAGVIGIIGIHMDSGQTGTASESLAKDGGDIVRDGNAGQTGTARESIETNVSDCVRNGKTGQA